MLMGRTGRDSLIRKVAAFDTVNVRTEISQRVEKMLKTYTENEARVASAGAGTFFVWVSWC